MPPPGSPPAASPLQPSSTSKSSDPPPSPPPPTQITTKSAFLTTHKQIEGPPPAKSGGQIRRSSGERKLKRLPRLQNQLGRPSASLPLGSRVVGPSVAMPCPKEKTCARRRAVDPSVEVRDANSSLAAVLRQGRPSYKEVLLRQSCPGHQGGRRRPPTTKDGVGAEVRQWDSSSCFQGWQVTKTKRNRPRTTPQQDGLTREQDERRSLFFRKMQGLCFNCLARDHKVAFCRNPTRCWRCRRFGHISTKCPSRCLEQNQRRQEGHCPGGDLSHNSRCGNVFVDDSLIFLERDLPLAACQKSLDPMVLEARLMSKIHEAGGVSTMQLQIVTPSPVVNLPIEDWMRQNQLGETPLMSRSKADQQIGHELIKALSNLNQNVVSHQSPPILPNASAEKKASVVRQEGSHCYGTKPAIKITPQKPALKVVRDMLTKKWVFVKEDKQLGSWTLRRFLNTYNKLSRGSSIEAIRLAMLMQGIKKLTQAPELGKKKKKAISHNHDSAITTM